MSVTGKRRRVFGGSWRGGTVEVLVVNENTYSEEDEAPWRLQRKPCAPSGITQMFWNSFIEMQPWISWRIYTVNSGLLPL